MSIAALHNVTSQFQQLFHNVNSEPLSLIFITIGVALLVAIIAGLAIYGMFKLVKVVPQMTTKQFVMFLIGLALFILAIGIFLP